MDKLILQDVQLALEEKRHRNEMEEGRRLAEMRQKQPEIAKMVDQRHQMVLHSVRSIFSGTGKDPVQQMEAYNAAIGDALEKAGYARDYLARMCMKTA